MNYTLNILKENYTATANLVEATGARKLTFLKADTKNSSAGYDFMADRSATIKSFGFSKQIYRPNCLEISIQIKPNMKVEDSKKLQLKSIRSSIKDIFIDSKVTFALNESATSINSCMFIALDYYVTEIKYENISITDQSVDIVVYAYSPDIYLTQNKHSQAFTGKGIDEIVTSALNGYTKILRNINTVNLEYFISINSEKTTRYFKIPYTIQYNESNYSFLSRVAKKYGEFLFYEDSKFNFGHRPNGSSAIDISDSIYNIYFNDYTTPEDSKVISSNYLSSVKGYYYNPSDAAGSSKAVKNIVNHEGASNESYHDIFNSEINLGENRYKTAITSKDASDKFVGSFISYEYADLNPLTLSDTRSYTRDAITIFNTLLNHHSYGEMVASVLSTGYDILYGEFSAAKALNHYYLEYIEDPDGDKKIFNPPILASIRYNDNPFESQSLPTHLKERNSFAFAHYINQLSAKSRQNMVTLTLKSTFFNKDLKLGSVVTIDGGTNADKYVVTSISMDRTDNFSNQYIKLDIIPYTEQVTKNLETIPYVIPYFSPEDQIKKADKQLAVVIDSKDPLKRNRVRVCYVWQYASVTGSSKLDTTESISTEIEELKDKLLLNATPWIRVATPSSKSGKGFIFCPDMGDEVIIDYENGNIEAPYVAASAHTSGVFGGASNHQLSTISSSFGQKIKLFDGTGGSEFITSAISPLASLISGFCLDLESALRMDSAAFEGLDGYTELTDKHGIYSLKMSSSNRNISINSKIGTININGLTGISIDAPCGDVSIKGKNIKLEAGNKLSIVSGANIDKGSNLKSLIVGAVTEAVLETVMPIDLKLVRAVYDALFKPLGGNMVIKSNRFLCLEAGRGEVDIVEDIHDSPSDVVATNNAAQAQPRVIKPCINQFIALLSSCRKACKEYETSKNVYQQKWNAEYNNILTDIDAVIIDTKKEDVKNSIKSMLKDPSEIEVNTDIFTAPLKAADAATHTNNTAADITALNNLIIKIENLGVAQYDLLAKMDNLDNVLADGIIAMPNQDLASIINSRFFDENSKTAPSMLDVIDGSYPILYQAINSEVAARRLLVLVLITIMREKTNAAAFGMEGSPLLVLPNDVTKVFDKVMGSLSWEHTKLRYLSPEGDSNMGLNHKVKLKSTAALTKDNIMSINMNWNYIIDNIYVPDNETRWWKWLLDMSRSAMGIDGDLRKDRVWAKKTDKHNRATINQGSILLSDHMSQTIKFDSKTKDFREVKSKYENQAMIDIKEALNTLKDGLI